MLAAFGEIMTLPALNTKQGLAVVGWGLVHQNQQVCACIRLLSHNASSVRCTLILNTVVEAVTHRCVYWEAPSVSVDGLGDSIELSVTKRDAALHVAAIGS